MRSIRNFVQGMTKQGLKHAKPLQALYLCNFPVIIDNRIDIKERDLDCN